MNYGLANRVAAWIGWTALIVAHPAAADSYQKYPLRVMTAQDILQIPASGVLQFTQNGEFALTLQNVLSAVDAKELKQTGFEIRLFRVPDADVQPKPWFTSQDGCDIYLSLVLKGLKFSRPRLTVESHLDSYWLTPSAGTYESGHFLMVVEENAPLDPDSEKEDYWEVFRLSHASGADYFHRGIYVDIVPLYGRGKSIQTSDDEQLVKKALEKVARTVSSKYRCYQPKPILVSQGGKSVMVLASCMRDWTGSEGQSPG